MKKNNEDQNQDFYTIAIGASAGGMEAIHLLFDHTPEDGVAYVIIQHLSPDHESFMAELLAKHSKLEISVAENQLPVSPNRVYLIPKGKNMTIKGGCLFLTDSRANQPNTAIDIFFDALAADQGDRSIAVVLSGTGSDGTKGVAAIKQNGGYVIVQDPETAKFNGMPRSAIESGNADVVLPPEKIPGEIISYLKRDMLESNFSEKITDIDEVALSNILDLIQENTPLDFSDYKRPTIIRRIVRRMTRSKVNSLREYTDFLKENPSEINFLAKEFLISVTEFFRDKEAFEVIEEKIIPAIVEDKLQVDTLKVWVVGCATGEEAYSLAILIAEHLTAIRKNLEVKIFASDIDKAALQHASKGVYPENINRNVSEERLKKYFTRQGDQFKVRDNIRKMIIFADHDIVKQPPYGKIDLISCRNLLIYINPLLQKKILSSLHFCLNKGGYLFLGPSESLGDLRKYFSEVDKKWRIFQSIEVARYFRDTTYSTPGFENRMVNPNYNASIQKNTIKSNLTELINQTLLEESGYGAGIWVDTDFEIIQTCGDYEKYLLPKIFNFNLLEMLPEELSIATATTLHKAVKTCGMAKVVDVKVSIKGEQHLINVSVKPFLSEDPSDQNVMLVLFTEAEMENTSDTPVDVFKMEAQTSQFIKDMKGELVEAKAKLREAYDALAASNDNISSYNEELISSNEEMQSTNEELQSVNEELQTVNNEYQLKIKELADLNDDLNNYFKSTINAQLYVDKDLILRKFTPSAIRQVNLKESDIGRLISDISTNIRFSTLMDDIKQVIASSATVNKEVQTLEGSWYQMIAMPYVKQLDNLNSGAIITFNDITELKKVQDKLSRINADHDTFIYAVSHDLKAPLANLGVLVSFLKESIELPTREDQETMDVIIKSISNLTMIIKELSDISKIENEVGGYENVNIKELLEEVEFSMNDLIVKSDVTIHLDLEVPEISFARKNLRSILSNILSNAIKYSSPERALEVTIRSEELADFTLLSVQDNGLGIPENKLKKIFGMFQRAHNHVEGSGVGLYLVKKTITNAGGDIEVESELGKGSTFKIYFKKAPVQ